MSSGTNISKPMIEVTGISPFGIWLIVADKEYFISYKDFPFFDNASIRDIADIECDSFGNLHWKALDVDIEIESLESPDDYPMVFTEN